jgi:hypothetical protein
VPLACCVQDNWWLARRFSPAPLTSVVIVCLKRLYVEDALGDKSVQEHRVMA